MGGLVLGWQEAIDTSVWGGGNAKGLDGECQVAPAEGEEELAFDRKSWNPGLDSYMKFAGSL